MNEKTLTWKCPKCGQVNVEYYPLPLEALCEKCGFFTVDYEDMPESKPEGA